MLRWLLLGALWATCHASIPSQWSQLGCTEMCSYMTGPTKSGCEYGCQVYASTSDPNARTGCPLLCILAHTSQNDEDIQSCIGACSVAAAQQHAMEDAQAANATRTDIDYLSTLIREIALRYHTLDQDVVDVRNALNDAMQAMVDSDTAIGTDLALVQTRVGALESLDMAAYKDKTALTLASLGARITMLEQQVPTYATSIAALQSALAQVKAISDTNRDDVATVRARVDALTASTLASSEEDNTSTAGKTSSSTIATVALAGVVALIVVLAAVVVWRRRSVQGKDEGGASQAPSVRFPRVHTVPNHAYSAPVHPAEWRMTHGDTTAPVPPKRVSTGQADGYMTLSDRHSPLVFSPELYDNAGQCASPLYETPADGPGEPHYDAAEDVLYDRGTCE